MSTAMLDEIISRVQGLDPKDKADLIQQVEQSTKHMRWVPNPGPQTDAYLSKADVLLYGGQAGGGKSHLEVGWGVNEATSGIIFRRELTQTDGLEKEGKSIIGSEARFNGQDNEWTWPDGKSLKLGGMRDVDSWQGHAGRERDYYGFDEAGEFLEIQVASIIAWLRAESGHRTRVILGSNPPRTSEGLWLKKWFAPWLDATFHDPASPGELRYAFRVMNGDEVEIYWMDGPGSYEHEGEQYTAQSYTFIPASLEDNPYRNTPEYRATLQSLPEPLRSQLLYGDFNVGTKDVANQCIPTAWVMAAIQRRKDRPQPPMGIPMCAIGVDCSGGGNDAMVLSPRYDGWFDDLIKVPGKDIPQDRPGAFAAGVVTSHRRDRAMIVVDLGGGYGGPLYEHLTANDIEAYGYKGAEGSTLRTEDGKLGFVNTRSAAYWRFREALNPDQPGGSPICLPDDPRLIAGLTALTFEVTPNGIRVEPKVTRDKKGKWNGGVAAKLGFSPDEADGAVMSWYQGPREATAALDWLEAAQMRKRAMQPKVVTGRHQSLSVRRRV